jgi:A/G-specific adenine glycosylase
MNQSPAGERLRLVRPREFRRALLAWYGRHARDLPWRGTSDPYRIWVSEIMLQQTTVAAVVGYFERFLKRFPTLADLARASEDDVLRSWEGLGYYSRARNLHRAARQIVDQHGGRFPSDVATLESLAGIGRYTAGAIASFAFDRKAPIVEANTQRLYARLKGSRHDLRTAAGRKGLWAFAESLLPARGAGSLNQALIELGATICTPRDPACERCPVARHCTAASRGTQHRIPSVARRAAPTRVVEAVVAVCRAGRYLLVRRARSGRFARLWDFVRFAVENPPDSGRLKSEVARETGLSVEPIEQLAVIRHTVTRFRITLFAWRAAWRRGALAGDIEHRWVAPGEFENFALSATGRRLAKLLMEKR